jgi:hypothetical protein
MSPQHRLIKLLTLGAAPLTLLLVKPHVTLFAGRPATDHALDQPKLSVVLMKVLGHTAI